MIKDKNEYRILIIEDNPGDFVIVEEFLLDQILEPRITHALNFKEATKIIETIETPFDVILLDLSLPDKSGQKLISEILQVASTSPVIILTGFTDIDFSIKSIAQGILDYLIKDDLNASILYKSIVYAIERKKMNLELTASEKRYSDLFHFSPQPMCLYEHGTFRFTKINKAAIEQYGFSEEEFLKMTLLDLVPPEEKVKAIETMLKQSRQLNETYQAQSRVFKKSGEIIEVQTYSTPIIISNKSYTLVIAIDVTEKNLYEHKITKAIIKTQEDERYVLGGELHDNICQILAASQLAFGLLVNSIPASRLPIYDQGMGNIKLALGEIRNLSHRLAPAFFDDTNLQEAFRKLLTTFNIDNKYNIILDFDPAIINLATNLDMQLNMYRILQEQLRNISKHAHASEIEVDMFIYNDKLKMKISDNGVGCDVNKLDGGIGIANMKRRTELFSGKFEILSAPGKGCTINVDIPLSQ